jgi:hypothetical protein
MTKHQYYRGDTRISEADALDPRGHIKDGIMVKVPAMMRDSDPTRFTDFSGNPWSASRPGFRVRVGDNRKAQRDALAEYERELTNRWRCGDQERACEACDGTGEDGSGNDCPVCNGEGFIPAAYERSPDEAVRHSQTAHEGLDRRSNDSRSLNQMMHDHRQRMARLYLLPLGPQ